MKKYFLIAIMALFVGISYGQNQTVDKELSYDQTFVYFNGSSVDTLGTGDSTWTYTVNKQNLSTVYPYVYVAIDTLTGTSQDVTNIYLQAKVFPDESYSNIDTVQYYASADTTFTFDISVSATTGRKEQFWRVNMVGSTDDVKLEIQDLNFKFPY